MTLKQFFLRYKSFILLIVISLLLAIFTDDIRININRQEDPERQDILRDTAQINNHKRNN